MMDFQEYPVCSGCNGKKTIIFRVQRNIHGHRICKDEVNDCPVCRGTGIATSERLDEFLNEMIPYTEDDNNALCS